MNEQLEIQEPAIRTRRIQGFPDYEVTSNGIIWSSIQKKWRRSHPNVISGYFQIKLKGNSSPLYVHRLVAEAWIGPAPHGKATVDHTNRNRQDNRAENLRWASVSENSANCKHKGTSSGYKGVHRIWNGTWAVRLNRGKVKHHLGTFKCRHEAARVYDAAARTFDGELAITNF